MTAPPGGGSLRQETKNKDGEHSLKELKDITDIPIKILKEVEKRGFGAYNTNLSCRPPKGKALSF